jgi:hypothetical protein
MFEYLETIAEKKAILVTSRTGSKVCEKFRLPHFLDNRLTEMVVRLSAACADRPLPPERFLVLVSAGG